MILGAVIPIGLLIAYAQISTGWSINPLSWFKKSKGCELNLNLDLNHDHEPVFLRKTTSGFELAMPQLVDEKGVFQLSKDERLFIACPGSKNELRGFSTKESLPLESKCVKNRTLHLNSKDVISSELECKNKVTPLLKESNIHCGNKAGKQVQLGFEAEGWHPLITLCYSHDCIKTLYTNHVLYGSVLRGAEVKSHQSYFVKGSRRLYTAVNPEIAYKQANQREVFTGLLGETSANRALTHSYLSRGHLSPDADFLLGTWQDATYFYINTAPQWQTINGGNWLRLENMIRSFAMNVKLNLSVTTGTYGTLKLKDENGVPKEIYLEPSKSLMPVPLVFWKIVSDSSQSTCIVFLVHNNPFLERAPLPICKNVCSSHGWPTDLDKVAKGFTYCCSFSDFRKVVDYVPDLSCRSVLKNTMTS